MPAKKTITLDRNYEGFEVARYAVWIKQKINDGWSQFMPTRTVPDEDPVLEEAAYMHVSELHFRSGNSGIPSASLMWRYGQVTRPGQAVPEFVRPLDIAGYYVKIEVTPGLLKGDPFAELKTETWHGIVWGEADKDLGYIDKYKIGVQEFQCLGLASLLNSASPQKSYWNNGGQEQVSEGLPTFNDEGKPNQSPGKHGTNIVDESFVFHPKQKEGDAQSWLSSSILEYLFKKVPPLGLDGLADTEFITWRIEDSELDKMPEDKPTVYQEGRTYWDLLRSLVSKYRLVDFTIDVSTEVDEHNVFDIKIFTMTDVALSVSNEFIADLPANPETIHLDMTDWPAGDVVLRRERLHKVDRVIGRGEHIVTVVSAMPVPVGNVVALNPGWTAAEKIQYDSGGSGEPDYPDDLYEQREFVTNFRSRDEVSNVYSRFELSTSMELPFEEEDGFTRYVPYEKTILRETKLQEGVNYLGTVLEGNGKPEREIFGVIAIPNSSKYVYMHKINESSYIEEYDEDAPRKWSTSIQVDRDYPSIALRVHGEQKQYVLTTNAEDAFGDVLEDVQFVPIPDIDDEPNRGEWDYATISVTMAIQDERKLTVIEPPELQLPQTDFIKVLEIDFGDSYQWIRLAAGTVVGIDARGDLAIVDQQQDIRNDRDKLTRKVKSAYHYYSKDRTALEISTPFVDGIQEIKIGDFIQTMAVARQDPTIQNDPTWNQTEIVNAVVTKKSYFFPISESEFPEPELGPATAVIETSFGELDFGR